MNYGKLGAESSSRKTQHTRQPFLPTRELSGQAQLPAPGSCPHATVWKCLSAYRQAKVIPDNICLISPCKTLNIEWKVSTNSIDTENIARMTEWPRTISHKPRPNRTRLHSSPWRRDPPCHLKARPCGQLHSRPVPCSEHGRICRVLCPSRYLAPAAAQRSAMIAGRLAVRGWLGSSWLLHRQSKRTAVCTDLCRRPVSTRQGTAAEYR